MESEELSQPRSRIARDRYKKKDVEKGPDGEEGSNTSLISIGSADDILFTSQESIVSVEVKKMVEERYTFTSRMEHLILYFCYVFSVPNLLMFVNFTPDVIEPSYFHYMVTFPLVGLPLLYMEMAMGQYTGSGILHFGKLIPFFHGVGWTMLLILVHQSLTNMAHVSDCMYYWMMSFGHLTFALCPEDFVINVTCLDKGKVNDCKGEGECEPSVFGATLFHSDFVDTIDYDFTKGPGPMNYGRIVCNVIGWVATGIIVNMGIARYIKVLKINIIICCALFMTIVVYVLLQSLDEGQRLDTDIGVIFQIEGGSLSDLNTWMLAVSQTVKLVGVGSAGHMLCGSYMRPKATSDLDAIFFLIVHYVVFIVAAMFTHTVVGFHTAKMGVAFNETHVENFLFTVIPQGLSLMPMPNLLCLMYFFVLSLLGVSSQVAKMAVVLDTMMDFMPKIKTYRSYLIGFISLACMAIATAFLTQSGYSLEHFLEMNFFEDYRITILIVELSCVHYLYGTQRFADDIHFLLGTQPTMFFKLSWLVLPLVFAYALYSTPHEPFDHLEKLVIGVLLVVGYYFLFTIPIIIGAVYKCIKYLQYRNLVGVLMPEETWGPTDPHERLMRRIYNPRFETRSRRRDHRCKHRCMKRSKVLEEICKKEKAARYQVTGVESDYEL